jgi:hypothetical protein
MRQPPFRAQHDRIKLKNLLSNTIRPGFLKPAQFEAESVEVWQHIAD